MLKNILLYTCLFIAAVVFAYPFLWMVAATFKPEIEIADFFLWSSNFSLRSYYQVFDKIPIMRAFFNSMFVSFCITFSVIIFGSIIGYSLSRLRFRGREFINTLILFTMMIPFQITLIPTYILMVKFGWVDTYFALVVPGMVSAFGILLFRQFFLSVPQALLDAARIDGYNEIQILFKIIYPLSVPVIITVGILTFMTSWNEVLWPIIVIRERSLMTMPQLVAIFKASGQAESQLGAQLASATLLALPVIVLYSFFQKYFIESMAQSGLKG